MSYPVSFISVLLGTITWHFHSKDIQNNLTFTEQRRVVPFFLIIILTKSWVMAELCQTISIATTDWAKVWFYSTVALLFLLLITAQLILHVKMKYSIVESLFGSLANLVSLARPTHDESQNQTTLRFYRIETLISSITYTLLSILNVVMKTSFLPQEDHHWTFWTGIGFALMNSVVTQLYLYCWPGVLFSDYHIPPGIQSDIPMLTIEPQTVTIVQKYSDEQLQEAAKNQHEFVCDQNEDFIHALLCDLIKTLPIEGPMDGEECQLMQVSRSHSLEVIGVTQSDYKVELPIEKGLTSALAMTENKGSYCNWKHVRQRASSCFLSTWNGTKRLARTIKDTIIKTPSKIEKFVRKKLSDPGNWLIFPYCLSVLVVVAAVAFQAENLDSEFIFHRL